MYAGASRVCWRLPAYTGGRAGVEQRVAQGSDHARSHVTQRRGGRLYHVVAVLCDALADEEFEERFRAGLALRSVLDRDGRRLPLELVCEAIQREMDARSFGDEPLKHVFTLLSLALEREPVELSLRALDSDDQKLRGTALEYLENVLPANVRDSLWPHVGGHRLRAKGPALRPREQIVDELKRSFDGISLAALEKGISGGSEP